MAVNFSEICLLMQRASMDAGLDEAMAQQLAETISRDVRGKHAGENIYVPKKSIKQRNEEIRRLFNGRNIELLCRMHQLSRRRIYQIVNE